MTMNLFSICRMVLLIFLLIVLVLMIIMFSRSVIGIVRNEKGRDHVNLAVSSALVAANAILGLAGAYKEHFLFTLIFAILQTIIIICEVFFAVSGWLFIPWVGSAVLAFILAFLIKRGYTAQ